MAESRLPCGASYDDLLAQVADHTSAPTPDHQRTCPHCRAMLAELHALWQPVHDLAAEDVHASPTLLAAVMTRVRELPRHTWHAVIRTDQGETRIAARILAAVARLAAEEVPSVTMAVGGGRTTHPTATHIAGPHKQAATDVGVAGTHIVIDVQVAIEMGTNIAAVAERLRTHISQRIATHTGLTPAEINVTIADVQPATR